MLRKHLIDSNPMQVQLMALRPRIQSNSRQKLKPKRKLLTSKGLQGSGIVTQMTLNQRPARSNFLVTVLNFLFWGNIERHGTP